METITFGHLSFYYPGMEAPALSDINLTIEPSSFVVVAGRSGCGKSTLLRHLKKNLTPYGEREGGVYYGKTDLAALDDRTGASEIGFVQQNPDSQIVTDKVWHELAFGLESLGYDHRTIRRRVSEMASFFGIQTWFRRAVSELSGGQKQLLNLASIMAMQPKVLVLDEPTSQLDPIASAEFLETLARINRELGTTIILSEHRLEEVFPLADRVLVMENGRAAAYDTAPNVGAWLSAEKESNPMFEGLPAVMKVYAEIRPQGPCPLTVRDGRLWLGALLPDPVRKRISSPAKTRGKDHQARKKEIPAVALSDVWFRYSRGGEDILRGLSLNVFKGEFFCMVGGNGVGKSTALKMITGIHKPYRGKAAVFGKEVSKGAAPRRIGMLPQNPQAVFTEITVEEELYDMLYYEKMPQEEKLRRVDGQLKWLEMEPLRKANPYDLSGGEQQRLALGKILLREPELLLLDEPTKGLDPFFKTVLAGFLLDLKKSGVTIVMVTHDIEFCAEYADRCAMMFDGDVVTEDEPRSFFAGNSFYTTAANRMSRGVFEDAVTYRDVVRLCRENGL